MYENQIKNVFLKMEKLLLIWISGQQAEGDFVNSALIRQKAKMIFDSLMGSVY
jgi:hypothetical protein